jgi:hypothetical protein
LNLQPLQNDERLKASGGQRHQKEVSENREWLQEHAMQKGVAMTREDVKSDQATWGAGQAETSL